ncbi:MAG: prepilin-type N-terminal cleavage/methylation domain-containing protein [Fibrobacter sp.]|uniref:prepilin-type N-terminal cleavage/methylation domain-containing protein n=1 Tax=Fibrobacter sp. TaxID=35828 RepID=UPI0025C3F28F|nr:prepilin-type N-terminal cleavage/methylation domain-containing protein [Fibrobacter sp.]MBR4786214.1 prepilin-type N-terminal cleavage/methylation domain-containing protein [Fibrobacter sp.]
MKKASHSQALLRKAGFTLIELLVYIAIVGIVVIVAGQAFSNSTKMRVRTQSMLKASEVAENVASLFKTDAAQTGAKSSMEMGSDFGGDVFSSINDSVYMDPANMDDDKKDFSSFHVKMTDGFSDLKMRRIRYDDQGHYVAVEEVNWFVQGDTLKRSCRTVTGTEDADDCKSGSSAEARGRAVEIATGISKFKVKAGLPGVSSTGKPAQVFPPCDLSGVCPEEFRLVSRIGEADYMATTITPADDYKIAELTGFTTNYDKANNSENASGTLRNQVVATENADPSGTGWRNQCKEITLETRTEYELSFSLADAGTFEKMRMFVPGRDQMSVGFRSTKDGSRPAELEDFFFYPPTDESASGVRLVRFSVPKKLTRLCIAFTFVSYSPLAVNGKVTISELRLKKVESANYKFDYPADTLNLKDRANAKALLLVFGVKRNGEEGTDSLVVPIPSNGRKD